MKTASPLDKGGLQGGFGAVTDNLVWVVDPEPHPGASRHPSDGGDFQGSRDATPPRMKMIPLLGRGKGGEVLGWVVE
jgi:hypothetical protein